MAAETLAIQVRSCIQRSEKRAKLAQTSRRAQVGPAGEVGSDSGASQGGVELIHSVCGRRGNESSQLITVALADWA